MADIRQAFVLSVQGDKAVLSLADNVETTGKKIDAAKGKAKQFEGGLSDMARSARDSAAAFVRTNPLLIGMAAGATAVAGAVVLAANAIKSLVSQAIQIAGRLADMSAKTGIAAEGLQELEFAAKMGGSTLEAMTTGVSKMQKTLVEGGIAAERAFAGLNLEAGELRQMAPEEAFRLIGDRIKDLKNPTDQAAAAMAIFGRAGADLLPAFKSGLTAAAEEARSLGFVLSNEAVAATDQFEDEVARLGEAWKGTLTQIGAAIAQSPELLGLMKDLTAAISDLSRFIRDNGDEITQFVSTWASGVRMAFAEANKFIGLRDRAGSGLDVQAGATIDSRTGLPERTPGRGVGSAFAEKAAANAAKALNAELSREKTIRDALSRTMDAQAKATVEQFALEREQIKFREELQKEIDAATARRQQEAADRAAEAMNAYAARVDEAIGRTMHWGQAIKQGFSAALADLPSVILGALQGGGDVGRSVGALLGGSLGKSIGDSLAKSIGGKLGGLLGSALPGIGSILGSVGGSLIGKAFGSIFGGGKEKEVNRLRDDFVRAAGGADELRRQAAAAGVSLDRLFAARDSAKGVQAAIDDITQQLGDYDAAMAGVNDAMQRWGISVDQMGPRFAQQELDKQAGALLSDFKLLTAAGADVATVLGAMAPGFQELVDQARASGAALPESMRPLIDQLIASGQLLDENGEAFKSAEQAGLTFAETMTEAMIRSADATERLVAALERALGIQPSPINIPVNYTPSGLPGNIADPGQYLPNIPSFAAPAFVRESGSADGILARIAERGTGGELVLPANKAGPILQALAEQSRPSVTLAPQVSQSVSVSVQGGGDPQATAQAVAAATKDALRAGQPELTQQMEKVAQGVLRKAGLTA